jgi:drug/metabolite transporter (DMT)-like permease
MEAEPSTTKQQARMGILLTFIGSLLLGSSYVAIKIGVTDIDPLLFATLVTSMAAVFMIVYTLWKGTFKLSIFRRWEAWAAMTVTFVLIACQYVGLSMTNASTGALIIGTNVLLVAPLSALLFKERLGKMRILGLAVGMVGLFVLTTRLDLGSISSGQLVGDALVFGATVCIALTYVLSKYALRHMTFDQFVLAIFLFTPLPLLALYLITGGSAAVEVTKLPLILYIGVLCTAVPTMLWVWGLRYIGMVTSSTIILSEATFAVILAVLILNEPINAFVILGAALTFVAIFLVIKGAPRAHNNS